MHIKYILASLFGISLIVLFEQPYLYAATTGYQDLLSSPLTLQNGTTKAIDLTVPAVRIGKSAGLDVEFATGTIVKITPRAGGIKFATGTGRILVSFLSGDGRSYTTAAIINEFYDNGVFLRFTELPPKKLQLHKMQIWGFGLPEITHIYWQNTGVEQRPLSSIREHLGIKSPDTVRVSIAKVKTDPTNPNILIYGVLENTGNTNPEGIIQSQARFQVYIDGVKYGAPDYGGKTSGLLPGHRLGPILIETKNFSTIEVGGNRNPFPLLHGKHELRLGFKYGFKDEHLAESDTMTIDFP